LYGHAGVVTKLRRVIMIKILIILLVLSVIMCDSGVITHELDCYRPGEVTCNAAMEKVYCSMDYEKIKVCDVVADCENECMHELVQVLVDDIQGEL
jgi:hypothetical protein